MPRKRIFVLVWLILGLLSPQAAAAELFAEVTETRLDNGLKLILMENRTAPVVTFQVWYFAGARRERWGKTGLAHVFEHMMFKGTPRYSGEEFSRLIQGNGGNFNAFTSHDFAGYFETLMADRVEIAIELEADRMQHLTLSEEEFETEKKVVMEERFLRVEDSPQAYLMEQVRAAAFQAQPYHWPIIGWIDDLKRLSVADARRHYAQYYIPANAFIVAVGDFDTPAMTAAIRKWFGPIPGGEKPPVIHYHDPPQTGERRVNVTAPAQLPSIVMGYHVPNLEDPDAFVLEVIAALLSAGKSSRLYESLVLEKQLALSAGAQNSLLSIDPDLFYLTAEPLPDKDIGQLENALEREIDRLKNEPVSERELHKAKNQLETAFIYSQDSLFYQAMLLARYEVAGSWEKIREYLPGIRRVTAEDVMRVAKSYFQKGNRTVGILIPAPPETDPAPPPGAAEPRSQRG